MITAAVEITIDRWSSGQSARRLTFCRRVIRVGKVRKGWKADVPRFQQTLVASRDVNPCTPS